MAKSVSFEKMNSNVVRVSYGADVVGWITRKTGSNWITERMSIEAADMKISVVKKAIKDAVALGYCL